MVDDSASLGIFTGLTFRLSRGVPKGESLAESIAAHGGLVLQYTTKHVPPLGKRAFENFLTSSIRRLISLQLKKNTMSLALKSKQLRRDSSYLSPPSSLRTPLRPIENSTWPPFFSRQIPCRSDHILFRILFIEFSLIFNTNPRPSL